MPHHVLMSIRIDKSGATTAAVLSLVADSGLQIALRQSRYLKHIVKQAHRATKRRPRPTLGFKSLGTAVKLIAGIETMHMIKTGLLRCPASQPTSAVQPFHSPAA